MKNIQSYFHQHSLKFFQCPIINIWDTNTAGKRPDVWLKIPRTVMFENVAFSSNFNNYLSFHPPTSKLMEMYDMTCIVEMFLEWLFRIIQTLVSIHWLSNKPSPTKENCVMLLLVRKRDSRVQVLQHVGFFSNCVLYFLKNDPQFNNSETKAHDRNTFIQLSYPVYNFVMSHFLKHDKYVK